MRPLDNEKAAFALLAREVFALDTAIQWFALEKAGREPCCAWRDAETGPDAELVDPFVLMLAEGRDGLYGRGKGEILAACCLFCWLTPTSLKSSPGSDGTTTPVWRLIATRMCTRWEGG